MAALIEVDDLKKIYRLGFMRKSVDALKGVTFKVEEGELYGFIGPNGAGKSTTIKILLGLLMPGGGKATLMGKPAGSPESRIEVGFLPEQPYFYDYLTGYEFLAFYGRLSKLGGAGLRARIDEVVALAGVGENWVGRRLRTYSKGMLQRLGLAQAIMGRPRLVILDEPMSGLDPLGRRHVRGLLKNLHAQGVTVFYSSHVLSDVEALCTRLAMVVGGEIRRQGTVDEVLAGEAPSYQITLTRSFPPDAPPKGLVARVEGHTAFCPSIEARDGFLTWAIAQGLSIEEMRRIRHSLEDVLAEEVGKAA